MPRFASLETRNAQEIITIERVCASLSKGGISKDGSYDETRENNAATIIAIQVPTKAIDARE